MPTKRRRKKPVPPQRSGWFSSKFQGALLTQVAVTCVYWTMGFPVECFGEYCITMAGISTAYGVARVGETVAQRLSPLSKGDALPAE